MNPLDPTSFCCSRVLTSDMGRHARDSPRVFANSPTKPVCGWVYVLAKGKRCGPGSGYSNPALVSCRMQVSWSCQYRSKEYKPARLCGPARCHDPALSPCPFNCRYQAKPMVVAAIILYDSRPRIRTDGNTITSAACFPPAKLQATSRLL